jgi:putative nucleotidyltransferase with HDIG domain
VKGRWLYRSRQFFGALLGGVPGEEMAEARRVLGDQLFLLFARMPKQYRRHGLAVYRRVVEAGCEDSAVQQAALLHDVGKFDPGSGRFVTIFHRVAVVLLDALPGGGRMLRRLSRAGSRRDFLLYPFYLSGHHAALGAKLAGLYGASEEVVALIARHHRQSRQDDRLRVLQAADDRS